VRAAAASGVFDVLAHLDLAKVFGHAASQAVVASEHDRTADAIAAAGVAVEISTAGLRKAAGELYPAQDLLRALHRRGVSDDIIAHELKAMEAAIRAAMWNVVFDTPGENA